MLKIDLQYGWVAFSKRPPDWNDSLDSQEFKTDTGNQGFCSNEIIFERNKSFREIPIWTLSTTSNRIQPVLKFEGTRDLNINNCFTYGKIDGKMINGKYDALIYFWIFARSFDMVYVNLKWKKVVFQMRFESQKEEFEWRKKAISSPYVWRDDSRFALRIGPRTIFTFDRKLRRGEFFRNYENELKGFDHFLGMFPSSFKSKLVDSLRPPLNKTVVQALRPTKYFQVVDLGEEYCGVYSKLRGSCFRLNEFEKVEDYFFVCFYEDKVFDNKSYCFLVYPFRGEALNQVLHQ